MPRLGALILALALHAGVAHAGAYEDILAGAEHNHTEAVLGLIQLGMDVNTAAPDGTTLLMTASRNGNLPLVDALLKNRANHAIRNRHGETALMYASLQGHLPVVKRLVELGGPLENRDGWSALQYAVFSGHVDTARYLLAKDARVDHPAPNSQTPLMLAAGAGKLDMVKMLIDEQASRKLRDRDGRTAAEIAAAKGHKKIVEYMALFDRAE